MHESIQVTRVPNLFIVGAPKSGTTALHSYLSQHPDVFCSKRKEFHYFCPDLNYHYRVSELDEYLSHFLGWEDEKYACDGSVWYLYSTDAAKKIKMKRPDASIIIMIRHPVDMLLSLHQQYLSNGYELYTKFEEVLSAQERRVLGHEKPIKYITPRGLIYQEACYYSEQIERFFSVFNKNSIHIVLFDNLRNNTSYEFNKVCQFLGIQDDLKLRFKPVNVRVEPLNKFLVRTLEEPPSWLRSLSRIAPRGLRSKARQMALNAMFAKVKPDVSRETLRKLNRDFGSEIENLSKLLGVDLSEWRDRYE